MRCEILQCDMKSGDCAAGCSVMMLLLSWSVGSSLVQGLKFQASVYVLGFLFFFSKLSGVFLDNPVSPLLHLFMLSVNRSTKIQCQFNSAKFNS